MSIVLKKINRKNLSIASKIQNEIFPEEDGTPNYIECIEHSKHMREIDYYIAYNDGVPVGITGVYSYHEYPEDAWLGWFGILPKYRKKGYGSIVYDKTEELAKSKGYKNFRLYTDESYKDAHRLYKKKGMTSEIYNNKDDRDLYTKVDIYIFSKSLYEEQIDKWNNKNIGLKEQGIKEHMNKYVKC